MLWFLSPEERAATGARSTSREQAAAPLALSAPAF
jgi:hypothetical protein